MATDTVLWKAPRWLNLLLIIGGALGFVAAFTLAKDKFARLADPDAVLSCSINPWIDCGPAMDSWQGAVLGFPNPLIGVAAFIIPILIGIAGFAGASFRPWFWRVFTAGTVAGLLFTFWLTSQLVYVLGSLCPWCFLVWLVMYAITYPLITWVIKGPVEGGTVFTRWAWTVSLANAVLVTVLIIIQIPETVTRLF